MKIAFLTTDNREQQSEYNLAYPCFGPAPDAVLKGLSMFPDEIEVHVISCSKKVMQAPEKLAQNIWFHQPIVSHIGWGRTLFLGCVRAVRKIVRKINPDIVHGQGTERDCSISAVLSGYPNVITLHGIMRAVARSMQAKRISYYGVIKHLEIFAIRHTAGVFCNSAYTESMTAHLAKKVWRVPNCIRQEFFIPLPLEENRKCRIIVLGSIISYKQPLEILEMWQTISEHHPHVTLVFIGPGSRRSDYENDFFNLLEDPKIAKQATHINYLEIQELLAFLDDSRGMIHFPTEESFGLAVAEGLSRNLKLFAANTGGIPDIIKGCEDVELFSSNDWELLAKRLTLWINQGMPTSNSGSTVASQFSPLAVARQHLNVYRELLGKSPLIID